MLCKEKPHRIEGAFHFLERHHATTVPHGPVWLTYVHPAVKILGHMISSAVVMVAIIIIHPITFVVGKNIIDAITILIQPAKTVPVGHARDIINPITVGILMARHVAVAGTLTGERSAGEVVDAVAISIDEAVVDTIAVCVHPAIAMAIGRCDSPEVIYPVAVRIGKEIVQTVPIQIGPAWHPHISGSSDVVNSIAVCIPESVIHTITIIITPAKRMLVRHAGEIADSITIAIHKAIIDAIIIFIDEAEAKTIGMAIPVVNSIPIRIDEMVIETIVVGIYVTQIHMVCIAGVVMALVADTVTISICEVIVDAIAIFIDPTEMIAIETAESPDLTISQGHGAEIKSVTGSHPEGEFYLCPVVHLDIQRVITIRDIANREAVLGVREHRI